MLQPARARLIAGIAERVRAMAVEAGMLYALPDKLGEREQTRQADLARLVRLAAELDDGELTGAGFVTELRQRFRSRRSERARRPPDDLPPGQGARVRRGLPAAARGEGAADEACAHRRGDRRGAAPVLRRDHPRAATPCALVVAQREPVPGRARPRPAPGTGVGAPGEARGGDSGRPRAVRRARRVAQAAREVRGGSRLHRLPQRRSRGDRRREAALDRRARRGRRASARRSSSATATRCSKLSPASPRRRSRGSASRGPESPRAASRASTAGRGGSALPFPLRACRARAPADR